MSAGCSLGGYHAVNVALRHPDFFYKAVGMSARYDLTISSDKFPNLLNGYFDENIYFNMPSMFMPNLHDDRLLNEVRNLEVTLVIGNEDPFFQNNEHLAETLCHKQVKSQFFVWNEEAHRAYYWRKMLPLYL